MSKKITIGNVCFIEDELNKKILFLKRKNSPMQGMCTGVGGKTDFCEDINDSCVREVEEETGLKIRTPKLRGVIKTILDGYDSSWILFVYTASDFDGNIINCDEGELCWVDIDNIYSQNLIGFIRRILPAILKDDGFLEGTIRHDLRGNVLEETLKR